MRTTMIGLGKLGLPCAEVMAQYHDIIGFDLRLPAHAHLPIAATLAEAVTGRELIFIAVQTPHDPQYGGEQPTSHLPPKDFDYSHVEQLLDDLDPLLTADQLVVLISTCLPGTVRRLATHLHHARLLYNPYLIAMGTVKQDFVDPEMIIVGTEHPWREHDETMADIFTLRDFYRPFTNAPRWEIGTWDEAEAIKIFYNSAISMKLALVNMIQDVAERNGHIDVDVVTGALAKSAKRITGPAYMTAGLGDGGQCHPRDLIALSSLSARLGLGYDLFGSIARIREAQARNMAQTALRYGKHVVILGKAYKRGVPYTAGSCSLLIGHYVTEGGGRVSYYDPNTGDLDLPEGHDLVYLIGYWDIWLTDFNCRSGSTIIDPWRKFPHDPNNYNVIHYGDPQANTFIAEL